MHYILMGLMAAMMVGLDQYTKHLTVQNIPLHGYAPGIDGIFSLTYFQNDGAAWSSFRGMQWLFMVIFVALSGFMIWEFSKKRLGLKNFERWCIAAVWAGGLGNMIDRVRFGYVVDMVNLEFMNFPIFNVADCFVTCGCIALIAHLVFFNKEFWKDDKKK